MTTQVRLRRRDAEPAAPREPVPTACYAPAASMYFDQFGQVRACCQNTGTLMGKVTEQSIREIWESASTRRLRAALARDDYSEGCGFCGWQVEQGDEAIVFARIFDEHPVTEEHPEWPVQMEFSMTNSCNLQCVMCNGDWSSSIRAHREHRPPLPEVYGEAFFVELADFLPHLRKVNFLGGEPFLGKEPLRVMGMLAELEHPPTVAVTTNGTQWSARIESICERLPISFVVSLDGITKATYEAVRVGSDFDVVMTNLRRFQRYAEQHGTMVSLAHCLMRPNWHEFSRFLGFAEAEGLHVGMNEVLFPAELSLFQLPSEELRQVVAAMEQDPLADSLDRLRPVWDGQLEALRHRLEALDAGEHGFVRPWGDDEDSSEETWEEQAERVLSEWTGDGPPARLVIDGGVATLHGEPERFLRGLGLLGVDAPDAVLDRCLAHFDGRGVTERRYTDMVDDVVVRDPETHDEHPVEFRVSWNRVGDRTEILVAVRNPPPPTLPEDPLAEMAEWCGADRVVLLETTADDAVTAALGPVEVLLGVAPPYADRTTTDLFGVLTDRHGAPEVRPGPSGFAGDSVVRFGSDPALAIRVMVDRRDDGATMLLGVLDEVGTAEGRP